MKVSQHKPVSPAKRASEPSALAYDASDIAAMAPVVHSAADAVTVLVDRLNSLALRVALVGGVADSLGSQPDLEAYLNRLSMLVDSAGQQLRLVQKLLQVLEARTSQEETLLPTTPPSDGSGRSR
jgi:hypothetical protein